MRTHSDGLLVEEEDSKIQYEHEFAFGESINKERESLSSSSLTDIDSACLNNYKDRMKVLPRLDPWLFKWVYQLYKISDKQIFELTPADGYLYLFFLKGAALLFLVLTILNCGILIPIY